MVRFLTMICAGLIIIANSAQALAQQCVPNPPPGPYTNRGGGSGDYGNVPVGISVVKFLSGYGGDTNAGITFSTSLDHCSDPAFSILGTECISYPPTGISCYAVVAFMPTSVGTYGGIFYGDITFPDRGIRELDTIRLSGSGVVPQELDLSVISVSVASGSSVPPGQTTDVAVTVAGTGFASPETRSTALTLAAGSNIYSQPVNLSALALGPKTIHFNVIFSQADVGPQTIVATINQAHSVAEATYSNNVGSTAVQVGAQKRLTLTLGSSQVYPDKTSGSNKTPVFVQLIGDAPGVSLAGNVIFSALSKGFHRVMI